MIISVTSAANVRPIRVRITSTTDVREAKAKAIAHVASKDNHITRLRKYREYRNLYATVEA